MNARAVADRLHCGLWKARQWCARWLAAQATNPNAPRVTLHRSGRRGRPSYRVDAPSFARWRRGLPAVDVAQMAA